MAQTKKSKSKSESKLPPARSLEDRQDQLINLAMDQAEQQLIDGTASSQTLSIFIKAGMVRDQLELEQIKRKNNLLAAQEAQIVQSADDSRLFEKAMIAFGGYQGKDVDEDADEFDY